MGERDVIYVGGGKGGVGKSVVASIAIEQYIDKNEKPILIETDDNNPDVYKQYRKILGDGMKGDGNAYAYDADVPEGWHEITRVIAENPDATVVINGRAADRKNVKRYGEIFEPWNAIVLWVVVNEPDGLLTLKEFSKLYPEIKVCVVLNGHWGTGNCPEEGFTYWAGHDMKNHYPSVYFPDNINARILIDRAKNKASYHEVYDAMHIGEKVFADIWLKKAKKTIAQAVEIAGAYK